MVPSISFSGRDCRHADKIFAFPARTAFPISDCPLHSPLCDSERRWIATEWFPRSVSPAETVGMQTRFSRFQLGLRFRSRIVLCTLRFAIQNAVGSPLNGSLDQFLRQRLSACRQDFRVSSSDCVF